LLCDYGSCDVAGGSAELCQLGAWTPTFMPSCQIASCPSDLPEAGSPCMFPLSSGPPSQSGSPCEYGTSNVSVCDTIAVCQSVRPTDGGPLNVVLPPPTMMVIPPSVMLSGTWELNEPDGGKLCQAPAQPGCPPSFDSVPRGAGCAGVASFCDYPEGRCRCEAADGSLTATWSCQDPTPPCPTPRARLGSPCTQEGLVCQYGLCGGADTDTQICRNGIWLSLVLDCTLDASSLFGPIDAAVQ
jgi:hypothetical protein